MATSGEGRWSKDERVWCFECNTEDTVPIEYDDDDNSWEWTCSECGYTHDGKVGE